MPFYSHKAQGPKYKERSLGKQFTHMKALSFSTLAGHVVIRKLLVDTLT